MTVLHLFDLPGFRVIECVELDAGTRRVVIMQVAEEHGCQRCGVMWAASRMTCASRGSRTAL